MPARMVARWGTATFRKDARRKVREVLGTSRADAPEVLDAITAAQHLDKIMDMASDGELRVKLVHARPGAVDATVTWREAREMARGEQVS
jgi:hypothetical protein